MFCENMLLNASWPSCVKYACGTSSPIPLLSGSIFCGGPQFEIAGLTIIVSSVFFDKNHNGHVNVRWRVHAGSSPLRLNMIIPMRIMQISRTSLMQPDQCDLFSRP